MNERAWNFSPGPGALPLPVLEQIRDEIVELPGAGASILEISHRSDAFERVIEEAENNLRELLSIPDTHRVLFLPSGASLQFAMVPINPDALRGGLRRDRVVGQEGVHRGRDSRERPAGVGWRGDRVHVGPRHARRPPIEGRLPPRHARREAARA